MKRMKILCVVLAFLACQQLMAQVKTLVMWHADGTTTDIELSILPRITFVDDKVILQASELQMEIDEKDLLRFTYKSSESSEIAVLHQETPYTQQDMNLIFHSTSTDKVAVYKTNGARVPVHLEQRGNDLVLSMMGLPSGVYLLKVNGRTAKILRP